ncbi:sugar efflux transporter [Kibdelosporangium persicum]|uniref:Sugar efflux transporter SetB n=1 Tax=Kibdelosporangium persicum TaxID=2698649 RepID=A0ABX2F2F5_9PSEU|nr:sugar efflux transporter [Kibdelosporangium persicum]NRN65514.1 Sugar efflux transporter SetB [Kibdelosporangium persicum]
MTTASAVRPSLNIRSLLPLASVSLFVGTAMSLSMPFMALFITDELRAGPAALGVFMFASPMAGLVIGTLLGRWSDSRAIRRNLLVAGGAAGTAGFAVFTVVREYWLLLIVSITLLAIAGSVLSQMFAYAHQFMERTNAGKAPFAVSILRTVLSLAWVGGPPLGAVIVSKASFEGLFIASAAFYLAVALVTVRLPELGVTHTATEDNIERGALRRQMSLAIVGFVLLQGGSALGVNAMPLFITDVLHGSPGDAGLVLGLCAALEIPLILWFGTLATKYDQHLIILLGASVALAYQGIMLATTAVWQIAAAQVLSAIVISAVMGVGITYFQSLAPDRPGFASTMYGNTLTLGVMVAGPLLGVAQEFGYRTAYAMALGLSILGIIALLLGRTRVRPRSAVAPTVR